MVADRFAIEYAETAPSCAFGCLKALEEVEEGDWGGGGFGVGKGEFREDCQSSC